MLFPVAYGVCVGEGKIAHVGAIAAGVGVDFAGGVGMDLEVVAEAGTIFMTCGAEQE